MNGYIVYFLSRFSVIFSIKKIEIYIVQFYFNYIFLVPYMYSVVIISVQCPGPQLVRLIKHVNDIQINKSTA